MVDWEAETGAGLGEAKAAGWGKETGAARATGAGWGEVRAGEVVAVGGLEAERGVGLGEAKAAGEGEATGAAVETGEGLEAEKVEGLEGVVGDVEEGVREEEDLEGEETGTWGEVMEAGTVAKDWVALVTVDGVVVVSSCCIP